MEFLDESFARKALGIFLSVLLVDTETDEQPTLGDV